MAAIRTEALTRRYGTRRGIEAVSLSIEPGALYGFLGPNGAGKTTTIRCLLGFLRPTDGGATILGMDCWRDSARLKAEVGAIPGDLRLWPWLSGHAAIGLFSRIRGRDITGHARELAGAFELDLSVRVRAMSRGMRQKLGLVLAMAHRPRVLILDEPTTALDPLMQDRLRAMLRGAARDGAAVFFSSHTLAEVEDLCERVAIVRGGRIVADSTLEDLKRDAGHDVEIVWASDGLGPPDAARVEGLELREATRARWVGRLRGPVSPLLDAIAGRGVVDARLARPDLETLFMRYYGGDETSGVGR